MGFEPNQEEYMKKDQMMWGTALAAMALILCLALTSCPTDENGAVDVEGGGGGYRAVPSLPSAEGVSSLQNYATPNADSNPNTPELDPTDVKSISEAVELFKSVTDMLTSTANGANSLATADDSVYHTRVDALFPSAVGNNLPGWLENALLLPLMSFVVPIDTPNELTNANYGNISVGRITGSSTSTYSANKKLGEFFDEYYNPPTTPITANFKEKGDTYTEDFKGNRTFAITNGFFYTSTNTNLKAAGHIYVEYSSTNKRTATHVLDQIYNNSSKSQAQFAVTLVATDGSKGAKFVLRGATASNSTSTWLNTVNTGSDTVFSNLEVYDNAGKPVALDFAVNPVDPPTIPVDHDADLQAAANLWLTFAQNVIARDVSDKLNP
jgi:ABC-type amino acid transport substrate-binding protein